jgi:hypothetical protein
VEVASSVPSSDPTQQRLTDLRNGLLRLHKILLDSERDCYEHEIAKITSVNEFLGLVIGDPFFAWLHELSQLIVLIDETQEAKKPPPNAADADRLVAQTKTLLKPAEDGVGFAKRYDQAMQRDPDVIIAHGQMARLLVKLAAAG